MRVAANQAEAGRTVLQAGLGLGRESQEVPQTAFPLRFLCFSGSLGITNVKRTMKGPASGKKEHVCLLGPELVG